MPIIKILNYIGRLTLVLSVFVFLPLAVKSAGLDAVLKYAWGDKMGWINFNPDGGNVALDDNRLSGYAWSENFGWINLQPDSTGVKNDGQGILSGNAWSENLGWIDFNGVRVDNGTFKGQASGPTAGTINFDCDHCAVKTSWRPVSSVTPTFSTAIVPVYPQSGTVAILSSANQLIIDSSSSDIIIPVSGGNDVKGVAISLNPDFDGASIRPYSDELAFNICPSGICAPGKYDVWLKFFSPTGHSSQAFKATVNYQGGSGAQSACLSDRKDFLQSQKKTIKETNYFLSARLSGRILLQVENRGRAWYVYPKDLKRYYLGCSTDAFKIMRELSLGISNRDFNNLGNAQLKKLSGIILLKVEDSGKAYYIDPVSLRRYYLGRPEDAFVLMRNLGLGITNTNLDQIKLEDF